MAAASRKGRSPGLKPRHAAKRRGQLLEICKALPEAVADAAGVSHLAFRIRKRIFGYYLFDHHGDGRIAFCCKAERGVQEDLVGEDPERFYAPPYLGPQGWVAVRLDLEDVDWGQVAALARKAYQQVAPRKLAAAAE